MENIFYSYRDPEATTLHKIKYLPFHKALDYFVDKTRIPRERIVEPVTSGDFAMYVGIRGRKTYWVNRLLHYTPILGGERALRRELWQQVPSAYKRNFQIEIALNFFTKLNGHRMGFTVVHGLGQVIKEQKRGLLPGLWQRILMIRDILVVSGRLYIVYQARALLGARPARPGMATRG